MKKILTLALALMMALSLAACGGDSGKTPAPGGTTDPGTTQQEQQTPDPGATPQQPSGGELYDIADSDIPVATAIYPQEYATDEAERAAVLDKIPSEIKKGIGTLSQGFISAYANKTVGLGGDGISFGAQFAVAGTDEYDTLKEYYKSLDGEVTDESNVGKEQFFEMEFSWGALTDCHYREDAYTDGTDIIEVSFTIYG